MDSAIGSGELAIADTVATEMDSAARNAIRPAAKAGGAVDYPLDEVVDEVLRKFDRLYSRFGVDDNETRVEEVGSVYADARGDDRMQGLIEARARVKERHRKDASMPTPEKNKGDFVILPTAAHWAARGHVAKLLTFDHDFVAFAIAIRERLGIVVVDCGILGKQ